MHLDIETEGQPTRRVTVAGKNKRGLVVGGFGLTEVQKDHWDEWLKTHGHLAPVKKGMIWAYSSRNGAESKAKELAEIKTGFEPIAPDNDPRMPKNIKTATVRDDDE